MILRRFIMAVMCGAWIAGAALADTVTFVGTNIPMRNCSIQSIEGGDVRFLDAAGRLNEASLDRIGALGFDGVPALDEAEALITENDYAGGISKLLEAMLETDADLQRLWIHARLARMHDARGEFVQACGHAAAVFLVTEDAYWHGLVPVSPPDTPSYAAAREAYDWLRRAKKNVSNRQLAREVGRMLSAVDPIYARLASAYSGPPIEPGSTISGVPRSRIGRADAEAVPETPEPKERDPARPQVNPATAEPAPAVADGADPMSPRSIDALLVGGRFDEALAICRRLAHDPGDRELGRYLYQFGRALAASARSDDAAIMFLRCALLYPDSPSAPAALIETAIIYRNTYGNAIATRRLLERAREYARDAGDLGTAAQAESLLQSMP